MKLPVNISTLALGKLKKALSVHKEMPHVRVAIKGGGGCGGVAYSLGLDQKTEKDQSYEYEGISFIINKGHLMHLVGLNIDYISSKMEQGFIFEKE